MNRNLRKQADAIVQASIAAVLPDRAVRRALEDFTPGPGKTLLVAAGKAAWQMAHAAVEALGGVDGGVVVTKYGHVKGEIPGVVCCEAGHPVPDENSFAATAKALELVRGLTAEDTVLFLLSGGGSALFEKPLIPGDELQDITRQLLASGADIVAMNTIRKRLSAVKGGRFAQACAPAQVYSIVLSDILGDPLDMIASGPAYPDSPPAKRRRPSPGGTGCSSPRRRRSCWGRRPPKRWTTSPPASPAVCGNSAPPRPNSAALWAMSRCCSPTAWTARRGRPGVSWPMCCAPTPGRAASWPSSPGARLLST